jgi:hypothetical protein
MTTKGRIDAAKLRSATEADKARWDLEDGFDDHDFGAERFALPKTNSRADGGQRSGTGNPCHRVHRNGEPFA